VRLIISAQNRVTRANHQWIVPFPFFVSLVTSLKSSGSFNFVLYCFKTKRLCRKSIPFWTLKTTINLVLFCIPDEEEEEDGNTHYLLLRSVNFQLSHYNISLSLSLSLSRTESIHSIQQYVTCVWHKKNTMYLLNKDRHTRHLRSINS